MAKNGVFKKITALAMAIALVVCFAVSASAVTVSTTTRYVDADYIDVVVNVAAAGANNNVTYYATKQVSGNTVDVHIDQDKADENGAVTFSYRTDAENLGSTTAKVGVTGADSATTAGGEVDGYTVTLDHQNQSVIVADEGQLTVKFNYEASSNMKFKEVTTTDATIKAQSEAEGEITVTFEAITKNISLTLVEETTVVDTRVAEVLEIGAVISTGKEDGATDETGDVTKDDAIKASEGDIKLTVIGMATGDSKYGILVSKDEITGYDANIAYEGATILTEDDDKLGYEAGLFAVQIINTEVAAGEEAMLVAGETYNVAVYVGNETDGYKISAVSQKTIPVAAAETN